MNVFDQYQRAVPVFSKYTGNPLIQLERARKDVLTGNLTPEEKAIMERLHEKGMDQAKLVREVSGSNDLAPGIVRNAVDTSMIAFQWVESNMNRKPAILASMRLFTGMKDKGGKPYGLDKNGNPYSMGVEEAEAKAGDFLDEAAGRYGRENRPEIVRRLGPLGSAVYTFTSWTAEYLNTAATAALHGEAGVLWRMFVAAALLGGIKAAPGADQIDEAFSEWFGVPMWHRIRGHIRAWLKETNLETGQQNTVEDFIMGGIPEAAGLSLSRSIGMNLPLISGRGDLSERMAGTLGSLGKKYMLSLKAAKDGDWQRSLEAGAPEGIANWLKAWHGYNEGVYTEKGYPLFDENEQPFKYTASEAVRKGLGITSPRESRLREADSELRSVVNFYEEKKRALVDKWRASPGEMEKKLLRFKVDDLNKEIDMSDFADLVEPINESSLINAEMKHEGTPARVGISPRGVTISPDREEIKRRAGREKFIGR